MERRKNWSLRLIGSVLVLMLGLIGSIALAQEATPETEATTPDESGSAFGGFFGMRGPGHWGGPGGSSNSNWLENLAEALGITVDQLGAAQEQAYAATVADAVAAGEITQEQADRILAAHALKGYIDRKAILASSLDMTTEELETALAAGQSLSDIMTEKGIDMATLKANAQAAYEAVVQQAVADGVITQAQADEFLSADVSRLFGHGGFGGHRGRGHGGRGGRGFGSPVNPDSTTPDTTTPETTDTSFDA